jgi:hypothetical protein
VIGFARKRAVLVRKLAISRWGFPAAANPDSLLRDAEREDFDAPRQAVADRCAGSLSHPARPDHQPAPQTVFLAARIDWAWLNAEIAGCFAVADRPGVPTRFMVGLMILKEALNLLDEEVCARRVESPYFQHFI